MININGTVRVVVYVCVTVRFFRWQH